MQLFRDTISPRKNLTSGAIALAFSSYQIGSSIERLIWSTNVWLVDYVFLVFWIVLLFVGIKTFRVGLASVPPDPGDQGLNQRTPGYWISRAIFWIVIIIAPVALIQFCARAR